MIQIEIDRIQKSYRHFSVLKDISAVIHPKEWVGIIGPNGSGKTTFLRCLSGQEKVNKGTIKISGKELSFYSKKKLAQMMAVLQQEGIPPLAFTVKQIVSMGRFPFQNFWGHEAQNPDEMIDTVLSYLNLDTLKDRLLQELSGGQRQRVALAQVMVQQPKLLILDEPTTFLDISHQMQVMDLIYNWKIEKNITIISVLHDLNLAAQYCDRLMLMYQGKLIAQGTPEEILTGPLISEVFQTEPIIIEHPITSAPQILFKTSRGANLT